MLGENWKPFQTSNFVTPPFGEYPSGHSAFSSASAEVLKRFTGSDVFGAEATWASGRSVIEPGTPAQDVTLTWALFSDAADEAGISRRHGGIHFCDGDLDSRAFGRKVAEITWKQYEWYIGGA